MGRRILAVDDHLPNLLVLDALLAELGVEVVTANSGFEAIERMTQSITGSTPPIDMIFMDVQMPRMSGLETSIEIRKIEQAHLSKPVPIIALTAHGLSDEKISWSHRGLMIMLVSQSVRYSWYKRYKNGLVMMWQLINSMYWIWLKVCPYLMYQNAADAPEKLPVVDWGDALERSANKPKLAYRLLEMLIDGADSERQSLERAWADRDRVSLADISHRMVGSTVRRCAKTACGFRDF